MNQPSSASRSTLVACPVCGFTTRPLFRAEILGKHQSWLKQCLQCGWAGFPDPHWLNEAYQDPISITDTGVLGRNIAISRSLSAFLIKLQMEKCSILDAAGGYGILVRLMRDIGHQCFWSDAYSPNIFARGFEADKANEKISVITLFEVLEHLPSPIAFLADLAVEHSPAIIVASTELYAGETPAQDWWYLSLETGQHVSFYTGKTLAFIASAIGLKYIYSHGFHIFLSPEYHRVRSVLAGQSGSPSRIRRALAYLLRTNEWFTRRRRKVELSSLTWDDHVEARRSLELRGEHHGRPATLLARQDAYPHDHGCQSLLRRHDEDLPEEI